MEGVQPSKISRRVDAPESRRVDAPESRDPDDRLAGQRGRTPAPAGDDQLVAAQATASPAEAGPAAGGRLQYHVGTGPPAVRDEYPAPLPGTVVNAVEIAADLVGLAQR